MRVENVDEAGPDSDAELPIVLVAEDDVLIRMWVCECLRKGGFVVIEAASAAEAQIALGSFPRIDLVFSDVNMFAPSDGIVLALWMATHTPDVPLVLSSGRESVAQMVAIESCPNVTDFVPKPYVCETLQRLLRERIGERKAEAR